MKALQLTPLRFAAQVDGVCELPLGEAASSSIHTEIVRKFFCCGMWRAHTEELAADWLIVF